MQKQRKQFMVVVILLVILILAYIGIRIYNSKQEEKKEKEATADKITVTDLEKEAVTSFSYQVNGETLSFEKNGDSWIYEGDPSIDLDEDVVNGMIESAGNLTAEDSFDDYDALSDYGLDAPTNTITLTTSDGTTTLYLGNENSMTNQYYLKTGDGDTIYVVGTTISTTFSKTVDTLVVQNDTETEEPTES